MRIIIVATALFLHTTSWAQDFSRSVRSDSLVDVIVEFVEEPMFLAAQNKLRVTGTIDPIYTVRFSQFASDIGPLLPSSPGIAAAAPTRQFYKSFFGAALRLPHTSLAGVQDLPYVKKIHPNVLVQAFLDKSILQMRAQTVWSSLGTQGEGVVVGGFDFVNNDSDPMDDEGHGTHVAGIVAADAPDIKGVAPKAKLFAFKVLDENGRGSMADVVAAIERTVDPNGDGDPSDKLDVVNLSLGSAGGDPDDAASTAVDNATRIGVTFCIAAGNAGNPTPVQGKDNNYYFDGSETIGSPGTSRLAITVGAVDSVDQPASFSSKGPAGVTFGVKPDVSAPGVNITSLALGSGTAQLSGTSMATPHVAGVAALVKSLHPSWGPAEIKSAIATTAKDLSLSPMRQGAGGVDAMRAAEASTFLVPTNLSFGLDDPAQATWVLAETLTVRNTHAQGQTYQVVAPALPSGVTITASPSNFTLATDGERSVVVSISVSNAAVPIVSEDIEIYGGQVYFNGTPTPCMFPGDLCGPAGSFSRSMKRTPRSSAEATSRIS